MAKKSISQLEQFNPKLDRNMIISVDVHALASMFTTSSFSPNYQPAEVELAADILTQVAAGFNESYLDIKKEYDELYAEYGEEYEKVLDGNKTVIKNGAYTTKSQVLQGPLIP